LVKDFEKIEFLEHIQHFFEKLFEKQAPASSNSFLEPPKVEDEVPALIDSIEEGYVPPSIEESVQEIEKTAMEPPQECNEEMKLSSEEVVVEKVPLDSSVIERPDEPEQPKRWSREVEQLLEMGFSNPLLLQGLLEVYKNDIEQTIVHLVHMKHD